MWVKFEITIRYRTESLSLSLSLRARARASVFVRFRVYSLTEYRRSFALIFLPPLLLFLSRIVISSKILDKTKGAYSCVLKNIVGRWMDCKGLEGSSFTRVLAHNLSNGGSPRGCNKTAKRVEKQRRDYHDRRESTGRGALTNNNGKKEGGRERERGERHGGTEGGPQDQVRGKGSPSRVPYIYNRGAFRVK